MKRTLFFALFLAACGDDASAGNLVFRLEAEDTIPAGIDPGDGDEDIVDGWAVRFEKFIATVGGVELERSDTDETASATSVHVVDLATLTASGFEIDRLDALSAGRWDVLRYATPSAEGAMRDESVSQDDFDAMVDDGLTYLLEGTLQKAGGQSCPPGGECRDASEIHFVLGVPAATIYGPCQAEDGPSGVAVIAGADTDVTLTIHGDHLFFNGFPGGAEIVQRRAQWLADGDSDGDGTTTREELEAIDAASLFAAADYALGGAPIPVETAWDFVVGEMSTVGHFQGEGECPWTLDR